jgi:AraC family transcriptional regulator
LADALVTRLICHFLGEIDRSTPREALSPATIAQIAQHIDGNLSQHIDVAELASMARLTRSHFSRAFQRMTGDPPQRFIMKRRICLF